MSRSGALTTGTCHWMTAEDRAHLTTCCSQHRELLLLGHDASSRVFSLNFPHLHGESALVSLLQGGCGWTFLKRKGFEKKEIPPPPPPWSLAAPSDMPEPQENGQMLSLVS